MTQTKNTLDKAIWSFLLFSLVSVLSFGQGRNSFSGNYTLGPYEGKATYSYNVIGIDTILDGPFKMERSNLEALLKRNDSSFLFSGNFKEGQPDGPWLFQFGEFYTDSTTQVSGFQYKVNVNGTLREAKGSFNAGNPNGKWRFAKKKIKDSQIQDTLFFSEVTFLDGVPQQSFVIENPHGELVGRFLRNGVAHDTWSLFSNEAENSENWYFTDGRLEKIEKYNEGGRTTTNVFGTPFKTSETINLDKGFGSLVSIYAQSKTLEKIDNTTGINALLVQNSAQYKKIDTILSELGSSEFLVGFKVKVPYFPLDTISSKHLDSTVKMVKRSKEMADGFLENTRLNLIRRSDEEAKNLYHTLVALDTILLKPLLSLTDLEEMGITENFNAEILENHLFPKGRPTLPLSVSDGKGGVQSFVGPETESFDFRRSGMEGYFEMARFVFESLNQISETLGQKLENDKQQQEFVLLEEQMIAQANGLNQFADSVRQALSDPQLKALDNIKSTAEELLSTYAEMPSTDEKLNQARMLITCLLHFDTLSKEIVSLPGRSAELQDKYRDAVWNPFTATIMDEMVKKRITSAYYNVLQPYLLKKVEKDLNCENVEELHMLFNNLHQRMLELRDEDTSKLERKLRKERNPDVVLQLFNLKPLAK